MTKNILKWGTIALLIIFSPLIYIEVLTHLTINVQLSIINAFSAKSIIPLATIIIFINVISATITAIITALPSGYLARKQAKVIAILLIIATQCVPLYAFFSVPPYKAFTISILLGEVVAVVLLMFLFAEIGSRIAAKKQDKATT